MELLPPGSQPAVGRGARGPVGADPGRNDRRHLGHGGGSQSGPPGEIPVAGRAYPPGRCPRAGPPWPDVRAPLPQLTYPVTADGLAADVRVNLDVATLHTLNAVGRAVPASIPATALIDTGTDITAVAPSILQQLGVPVYAHRRTQGIGGPVPVRVFRVAL